MGLAPGPDAVDLGWPLEDIPVLGFVEPAPLTVGFTGGAARRFAAEALALDVAWIRNEEPLTVPALTSISSRHDSASAGTESQPNHREERKSTRDKAVKEEPPKNSGRTRKENWD
jgi:hypothetical protein